MGYALANFACVSDPDVIVIGGGVSRVGEVLVECVKRHYEKYAFSACKETPIRLAELGNDAGIYGSAKLILAGNHLIILLSFAASIDYAYPL